MYLTHVLLISDVEAGVLLFIGQVADALATPLVGIVSDTCTLGRKCVLAAGTALVGISYPLMYQNFACWASPRAQFWYLANIIVVFQFGWAAAQISHLALLSDIGTSARVRTLLNSIRFGATVSSNLVVFLAAFFVLSGGQNIEPGDAPKFRLLAYMVSGFGLLCATGCLAVVTIPKHNRPGSRTLGEVARIQWWQWLCRVDFWQAGVLYMCARLITNTVQVYLQLYVVETLHMRPLALALVPSGFFLGQMAASLGVPVITQHLSSEGTFTLGLLCIGLGSFSAYLADVWWADVIYGGSMLMGVGCGVVMVISLAIVADLVSNQKQTAAWVYGLMSFSDKLSGGIALLTIQHGLQSFGSFRTSNSARAQYLLYVVGVLPVAISAVAFLTMTSVSQSRPPPITVPEGANPEEKLAMSPHSDSFLMRELREVSWNESRFGWGHWPNVDPGDDRDLWGAYIPVP